MDEEYVVSRKLYNELCDRLVSSCVGIKVECMKLSCGVSDTEDAVTSIFRFISVLEELESLLRLTKKERQ